MSLLPKRQPMADEPTPEARVIFTFAHDLRTHLRTVLTRIQLVQRSAAGQLAEEDEALLQEAATAAGDIQGLVTAMVAYWEAGSKEPSAAEPTMRLPLLLRGVILDRINLLRESGGKVEVSNDLDNEVPAGLQTVLRELITNSWKFRRPDLPLVIKVSTLRQDDLVEIAVSDNGMGISPEFTEKVFTPFQRLNGREYPGYGLGLATSRRLVQAWGGSLNAQCDESGTLTMRVAVPVKVS